MGVVHWQVTDFGKIITKITVPIVYNVLHRLLFQYGVKKWLLILIITNRNTDREPGV